MSKENVLQKALCSVYYYSCRHKHTKLSSLLLPIRRSPHWCVDKLLLVCSIATQLQCNFQVFRADAMCHCQTSGLPSLMVHGAWLGVTWPCSLQVTAFPSPLAASQVRAGFYSVLRVSKHAKVSGYTNLRQSLGRWGKGCFNSALRLVLPHRN